MKRLTVARVKHLKKRGLYADGDGLYLQVRESGKSWVFRFMLKKRARMMGLGPVALVSLLEAREAALVARKLLHRGIDPIEARNKQRTISSAPTFSVAAQSYIDAHAPGWKNAKHAAQWKATLRQYAEPTLGGMLVSDIGTDHILKVLEPIWLKKTETASRVRGRIESILSWSTARGYRNGENPARWRGHLDQMLPARSKVQRVRHHPAMCYSELPEFMAELRKEKGVAARALEFTILTASRTNEVINARWVEITLDGVKPVWVIPRERMKADKEHRVPLTRAVVAVLRSLPVMDDCDWVFPGRPGRPLSSAAMRTIIQRMGRSDVTTHGFRSSFRDWCGEETSFPRDVVEAALAHQLRDKTEAAYRRGDALERRRKLMDAWSKYALALQDKAVRLVRASG